MVKQYAYVVCLMEEADLPQVVELEKEIFSQPWSLDSFRNGISSVENIYLVAKEAEKIIGYCGMWCVAGEGQIYNVAVSPACRGKHVGRALMQALLDQGKQRGLTAFTLEVRAGNQPAVHLYEKLGFENVGIRRNFYDLPKEDAIIMWLYLNQNTISDKDKPSAVIGSKGFQPRKNQ